MELKRIKFKLDKIFTEDQEIIFDNSNICLIGNNGIGKSTFLKAIYNSLASYRNQNFYRYFNIQDNIFEYILDEYDQINELLNVNKNKKLEVIVEGNKNTKQFKCDWLIKEHEYLSNKIIKIGQEIIGLLNENVEKFEKLCSLNSINKKNYFYNFDYIFNGINRHMDQLNESSKTRELNFVTLNNPYRKLYRLNNIRELVTIYGGDIDDEFNLYKELFKDFKREGKSNKYKIIEKYNGNNSYLKESISKKINEYNKYTDSYDKLFSRGCLYNYFQNNLTKNIIIIDHQYVYSDENEILESSINCNFDYICEMIYKNYELNIDNFLVDFNYYEHIRNMINDLPSELICNDEDLFDKDIKENQKALDKFSINKDNILIGVKNKIYSMDIYRTYLNNFNDFHIDDDNLDLLIEKTEELVENTILNSLDYNLRKEYTNIEIDNSDQKIRIYLIGEEKSISITDLSSGTLWRLKLNLIKNLVQETDILLIDEPALFLGMHAQRKVLEELLDLNCNVIYTTHTPSLLPINLNSVKLYEVVENNNTSSIKVIENNFEEKIIENFGLINLQNVFIDNKKTVLLIHQIVDFDVKKNFEELLEKRHIKNDIKVLYGELNENRLKTFINIFKRFGIKPFIIIQSNGLKKVLNKFPTIKYFDLANKESVIYKSKDCEFRDILED